jgi:GTP-binding protein
VNKVDSGGREAAVGEAFALGFLQVFPLSASHGRGVGELLDALVAALGHPVAKPNSESADAPSRRRRDGKGRAGGEAALEEGGGEAGHHRQDVDEGEGEGEGEAGERTQDRRSGPIRIAFVGKPNVGKSSLVNRLLGQERVLVHDAPGTTRDPIDTPFSIGSQAFILVDTAGLRRRRSIDTLTEHVAAKMARDQLERCDVAAMVIDARAGATAEDARLASLIEESGRATVLILNKKDLVPRAEIDKVIAKTREELAFVAHAPVLLTSATTGAGVSAIASSAVRVFEQASRRIPTGELNRLFEEIVARQPPPSGPAGRHVRLYYITQAGVRPPTFFISTNQPTDISQSYRRFLVNQIRKAYGFEGTPIRVVLRARRQKRRPPQPRGAA